MRNGVVCQAKKSPRYKSVLLIHSGTNLTTKSEQRGCVVRKGIADDHAYLVKKLGCWLQGRTP